MADYILDDIRAFLITQGVVPSGFQIYEGYIPNSPDTMISLYETGGLPADTLLRENERVTFQTRVRAGRLAYQLCKATWQGIFNALQDSQPTSANGTYYLVQAVHYGPLMFNDDLGRTNMVSNWRVLKTRS